MMITEYTPIKFKGFHLDGKTSYNYWVIKLGENLYYKMYDEKKIEATTNEKYAAHIANEKFTIELIGFLKKFYDEHGHVK